MELSIELSSSKGVKQLMRGSAGLRGRVGQGQLKISWEPGGESWAGYFKKHHSPSHHSKVRPAYLKEKSSPRGLRGGIGLAKGHQPAGAQGQAQGLSQVARDALARALGMPAAPQTWRLAGRAGRLRKWQLLAAAGSCSWQAWLGSQPGQCPLKLLARS